MLRVPAVCNSQAWRILSIGPSFPKYLLHSVILGAKCPWLIPLLPFLPCSTQPCHARGLWLHCHCISGVLPSHSGDLSFAFWLKCPEQCLWEHGAWCGHGFSLEVCFLGCVSSVANDGMAAVGMEQSCTKLSGHTGITGILLMWDS